MGKEKENLKWGRRGQDPSPHAWQASHMRWFFLLCFRWSQTPLDEALHFGHHSIADLLTERGGERGKERAEK